MSRSVHRITAPAEIDPATVHELVNDLDTAPEHGAIEVDCSKVTFMDSAGVRALSMASQRQQEAGGSLRVVRPTDVVRRILQVTALDGLIVDAPTGDGQNGSTPG